MADEYRLIIHPDLARELTAVEEAAAEDPGQLTAQRFAIVQDAVAALRDGREAEYGGERLGYSEKHSDLRDCAEIKVPIIQEFNRRGQPRGPSHRIIYREFDPPDDDPRPVRQLLAYERRRDGRPFAVAAQRLGRSAGRSVLDRLPAVEPATGPAKARRPVSPIRRPMPADLAAAFRAAANPSPAHLAAAPPPTRPVGSVARSGRPIGRERTI
jgi:hypothetical protein